MKKNLIVKVSIFLCLTFSIYFFYSKTHNVVDSSKSSGVINTINGKRIFPRSGSNLPLIAIIDSGIYTGNKYLNKNNIDQIIFDNLSKSANQDHGTRVAGLIIGRGNGRTTPQGLLPDAKLLSIQVGSSVGMSSEQLAQAIDLAVQKEAKIINISQGAIESTPVLELSV